MANVELLDFYADWCGPCHEMEPIIEEIEKEMESDLTITKINVDEHPDIASQYNVMSIPTYIIKKDGQVADQLIGAQPKDTLVSKLK